MFSLSVSPERLAFVLTWAALGWLIGLWLNRVAYALPADQSIRNPVCTFCGTPLGFFHMRQSACPTCHAKLVYDRLEWVLGALFALLAIHFGPGGSVLAYSVYTIGLTLAAAIDFRHRYVYTVVTLPSLIAALALAPTLGGMDLLSTIEGLGVGLVLFLFFYVLGRLLYRGSEPVGKGDLELAAVIGAMVGFPRVLSALFLGGLANGIVICALLLTGRRGRTDFIPYGPGLCLGAFTAFFLST